MATGWVNQWGEVKTKKAKKESQQKAKTEAAAVATQQQHQQSPSFYSSQQRSEKSDRPQKASERGARGRGNNITSDAHIIYEWINTKRLFPLNSKKMLLRVDDHQI